MVQPKTPPLSIRLGDARLALIEDYAKRHGLKRHAAVLELIDVGLLGHSVVASQRPTPKPVTGSKAATKMVVSTPLSEAERAGFLKKPPPPYGSLLKNR